MRILIVEDEEPASGRLIKMIGQIDASATIAGVIDSVADTVKWLNEQPPPDLMIMDIQLSDGISFDIFAEVDVKCPVIFTTAYDEYALKAFKVNSIDYLLKPVKKEELAAALSKFTSFHRTMTHRDLHELTGQLKKAMSQYQRRLVIRYRDLIKVVPLEDAAYFYSSGKINFVCTADNHQYPVDHTLDDLETMLDPVRFFRINRQLIVSFEAIDRMIAWSKSRVKLELKPPSDQEAIVSAERSSPFKEWLLGR